MAIIGTFGSFTTARLGIYASQASLQVTGNNIANINTKGYTRQRADLYSLNSTGLSHYANPMGVDIGYGVLVKSTTQLRDPYLDIRFRNENSKLGSVNATLAGLNKIAQTLDEVNKGGTSQNGVIENALQEFKSALQDRDVTMGAEEYDSLVREAAKSLITFFNTASKNLQTDWDNQASELKDTVGEVNKCLTNIRDLNEQIRKQGIYGDLALELRDHRNVYIDELSEYLHINVEYSMERIDQYTEVEKLTISLADTKDPKTGLPIKIIDGLFGGQLTFSELEPNPLYNPNELQAPLTSSTPGKYLMEDGETETDDPDKAARVLVNPEYAKSVVVNPEYAAGVKDAARYLDADGNPTNDVSKAAHKVSNPAYASSALLKNPDYDSEKADSPRYLDTKGEPTDDPAKAARVQSNPQYNPKITDPEDPRSLPYLDEKGVPTNDPTKAAAVGKYLKADGKSTDDIKEAEAVGQYLMKDEETGELVPTADITKAAMASRKYLTADGKETNYEEAAGKVDPNTFLLQVERLEDKYGRPLNEGKNSESVIVPLNDNDLAGSIQAMRELLTEEGEFASKKDVGMDGEVLTVTEERAKDPNANIKKGIPYYQKRLDALAQKFAEVFNEANQLPASTVYKCTGTKDGDFFTNAAGAHIQDSKGRAIMLSDVTMEVNGTRVPLDSPEARKAFLSTTPPPTDAQIEAFEQKIADSAKYLEVLRDKGQKVEGYEYYDGGVLFSSSGNNNDASNITAGNISISNAWASRVVHTLRTRQQDEPGISHSSRSDNIDHMISLFEKQLDYTASDIEPDASGGLKNYFHGSFQEMYTDIGATLGGEQATTMGIAMNYEIMTLDLDNDRSSVSGVDLNEEATSMMQFQKSYQAACRLLTTIDSMLDTLINNTLR